MQVEVLIAISLIESQGEGGKRDEFTHALQSGVSGCDTSCCEISSDNYVSHWTVLQLLS